MDTDGGRLGAPDMVHRYGCTGCDYYVEDADLVAAYTAIWAHAEANGKWVTVRTFDGTGTYEQWRGDHWPRWYGYGYPRGGTS